MARDGVFVVRRTVVLLVLCACVSPPSPSSAPGRSPWKSRARRARGRRGRAGHPPRPAAAAPVDLARRILGRPDLAAYHGWVRYLQCSAPSTPRALRQGLRGDAAGRADGLASGRNASSTIRSCSASCAASPSGPTSRRSTAPASPSSSTFRPTTIRQARRRCRLYMHGYSGNHLEHCAGHEGARRLTSRSRCSVARAVARYRALSEADVLGVLDYVAAHWSDRSRSRAPERRQHGRRRAPSGWARATRSALPRGGPVCGFGERQAARQPAHVPHLRDAQRRRLGGAGAARARPARQAARAGRQRHAGRDDGPGSRRLELRTRATSAAHAWYVQQVRPGVAQTCGGSTSPRSTARRARLLGGDRRVGPEPAPARFRAGGRQGTASRCSSTTSSGSRSGSRKPRSTRAGAARHRRGCRAAHAAGAAAGGRSVLARGNGSWSFRPRSRSPRFACTRPAARTSCTRASRCSSSTARAEAPSSPARCARPPWSRATAATPPGPSPTASWASTACRTTRTCTVT